MSIKMFTKRVKGCSPNRPKQNAASLFHKTKKYAKVILVCSAVKQHNLTFYETIKYKIWLYFH